MVQIASTEAESVNESVVRRLTTKQKDAITNHYKDLIASNKTVLITDVRSTMKHDPTLRKISNIEGMVKKVVDCVRHLQYKHSTTQTTTQPDELPESASQESTQKWVDSAESLASSSSTRMDWSQGETEIIVKHFGNLKEHPKRQFVADAFQNILELKPFLETRGFDRCFNKVKNTVKKIRKQKE